MRRFFKYGTTAYIIAFPFLTALLMSLTFASKDSYKGSSYYRFARQQLAWTIADPKPKYALRAGWARVPLLPPTSVYISPDKAPATTDQDSIDTRVLVLDNGSTRAVLITVDLLMMPPTVTQELQKKLPQLGFAWKNTYLGATNAQHPVGGWANDYIGQQTYGDYNKQWVNQLTNAVLRAVVIAQKNMTTAQIGYQQVDLNGQKTLSWDRAKAGIGPVHLLKLRKLTGESAIIYSGYGRLLPSNLTTPSTGDEGFTSTLTHKLEQQTRCFTLCMAGPIQDMAKPDNRLNQGSPANNSTDHVATHIASLVNLLPVHTDSVLIAQTTTLAQAHSDPQIRISQNVRLKSWLARRLYGDYPVELKTLQIGNTVFVGFPGALSAELVPDFLDLRVARQKNLVMTSYNGGNIGQIVPDKYYTDTESPYNITQINRFGPYTAEFMVEMTQSLCLSLK